jgi:hypothetical protein
VVFQPDERTGSVRELFEAGLQSFAAARISVMLLNKPLRVLFEKFVTEQL